MLAENTSLYSIRNSLIWLKTLEIRGFKAFKEAEIEFKPLTILIGANSSGKTSILQSLLLLKQSWELPDPQIPLAWEGKYIELPGFDETVNKSLSDKKIGFSLIAKTGSLNEEFGVRFNVLKQRRRGLGVEKETFQIIFSGKEISLPPNTLSRYFTPDKFLYSYRTNLGSRKTKRNKEISEFAEKLEIIKQILDQVFRNIYHIHPLREAIKRYAYYSRENVSFPGSKGERLLEFLKANPKIYASVKEWAEEHMCRTFELKTSRKGISYLQIDGVNASDTGFGFSQILPIVSTIFGVPEGSMVLLEQPEVHLNPSLVVKLTDFFVDIAKKGNKILVIETHSDHLLWRIRRRVAEDMNRKLLENIALYFVERTENQSKVIPVKINEYGEIEKTPPWPKDFFSPDISDAIALAKAKAKKLKKRATDVQGDCR